MLSLAGIAVMVGLPGTGTSGAATPGVLLALAGALLYALYIPMINHLGRELPPALTATYAATGAGVIFTVVAVIAHFLVWNWRPWGGFGAGSSVHAGVPVSDSAHVSLVFGAPSPPPKNSARRRSAS